jgi:hypothetical protein
VEHRSVYALLLDALSRLERAKGIMQKNTLKLKLANCKDESYVESRIALAEIEGLYRNAKEVAASIGAIDSSASGVPLDAEWDPRVSN